MKTLDDLRELQRTMADALMQPLTRHDSLRRTTRAEFIKPNDCMSGFERLEIYARQYWFRLLDCLYDDYSALRALLGERRFHRLCHDYLAAHPSTSWTLRDLGSRLPQFITDPKARDVARVEWAQTLAFDEAQRPPLDTASLTRSDPATLRLGLQPCVVLVQIDHAVDHFITTMKNSDVDARGAPNRAITMRPARTLNQHRPALKRERVNLAVHRHDNRLYFKRLTSEAFYLLTALRDGLTLVDAVECALAHNASTNIDWPAQIRDWFAEFTQLGWLTEDSSHK